jgi:hypothetical protein
MAQKCTHRLTASYSTSLRPCPLTNQRLCFYSPTQVMFIITLSPKQTARARGGAVVEALRNKPEGRWIDSRWCHWNFSLTSFRPHYGPGVDSTSNRNEYQEYFLGVKVADA